MALILAVVVEEVEPDTQAAAAVEELVANHLAGAPCTLSADAGHYHQRFHHFPTSNPHYSQLASCLAPMLSTQQP